MLNHLGEKWNTLLNMIQKFILVSRNVASPLVNPNWKDIDNGHTKCKNPCWHSLGHQLQLWSSEIHNNNGFWLSTSPKICVDTSSEVSYNFELLKSITIMDFGEVLHHAIDLSDLRLLVKVIDSLQNFYEYPCNSYKIELDHIFSWLTDRCNKIFV